MTQTYEATGKSCLNCGSDLQDSIGHWSASEAYYCNDCYDDDDVDLTSFAQVIQSVPKKSKAED